MFIGAMLMAGMMAFNSANAQSVDEIWDELNTRDFKDALKDRCKDDDQYMAEVGKATSATAHGAERQALLNCQQLLKMRLEQTVKGVVEDLTHDEQMESPEAYDAITLRKINTGFQSVIEKSIGRTIKCYSVSRRNEKGQYEARYNGKIAIEEFVKEAKSTISQDALLRANIGLNEFEQSFREHLKNSSSSAE